MLKLPQDRLAVGLSTFLSAEDVLVEREVTEGKEANAALLSRQSEEKNIGVGFVVCVS